MPSGSSAEDFLFGNLGWVGTSPRLLSARATFNRQRGNLAGKQSLAHSHFFYGIVLKREPESYSFLLVIVPWEPGVNRPSLRWVGWSFKESQRFTHPFPHNRLGESSCPGARSRQERRAGPQLGTGTGRAAGGGGPAPLPALGDALRTRGHQRGSSSIQSHAVKSLWNVYWRCTGHRTVNCQGARDRKATLRSQEGIAGRQTDSLPPCPAVQRAPRAGPTSRSISRAVCIG